MMRLFRRVVPLSLALFGSSLGRKSQLGLTCGNTGACDEFEVELAEEELAAEMQVELLQRMPMDIRLASEGVANATSQSSLCLLDHLVGSWHVQNALGIDGVTVLLDVSHRPSKECHQVTGQIHYLGKQTEYQISALPLDSGKLYVKFMNDKADPAYFHEGEYDITKDVLFEDLGAVNGVKQNDDMQLFFKRING
mmetsp:Transcript_52050/g.63744  ORF Transcript_52050/g.63744 Transcript_52050/m.63744 type:complete len:195 (+) Transcript_52050:121-705(+)